MEVNKDQFPVVVQAYDMTSQREAFIAEQVVNSQAEINAFTTRYTGKLIKARQLTSAELSAQKGTPYKAPSRKSNTGLVVAIILIILAALIVIGFYTGWIQRTFGINLSIFPAKLLSMNNYYNK
jgi:hypothetical protein